MLVFSVRGMKCFSNSGLKPNALMIRHRIELENFNFPNTL